MCIKNVCDQYKVGETFYPVRKKRTTMENNEKKLRWKNNYRINSSMHIKKVIWLCAMRWDNTASICCYGHSEKSEESLSSKYFCIIVLHDCDLKQQVSTSERSDSIYCYVCSFWGASNLYYTWNVLYSVASPIFLVIFSATVYQEVTILFSSRWMKRCFIRLCFMWYSSFAHKLNSNLWMET